MGAEEEEREKGRGREGEGRSEEASGREVKGAESTPFIDLQWTQLRLRYRTVLTWTSYAKPQDECQ